MASILVIDPNTTVCHMVVKELTADLQDVKTAATYEQAMGIIGSTLQPGRKPFDVICIDAYVGNQTGLDILERIRRHRPYRDTPVVGGYAEINIWKGLRSKAIFPLLKRTREGKPDYYWDAQAIQSVIPMPI